MPGSSEVLEPNVDVYGTRARPEALADLLEISALGGRPSLSRASLADYVRDKGWLRKEYDFYSETTGDPESEEAWSVEDEANLGTETDKALDVARAVFEVLRDREHAYGSSYPFALSRSRLEARAPDAEGQRRYLALLAVSFLHGYGAAPEGISLPNVAEEIVAAVLRARGLDAVGFGAARRQGSDFEEALSEAAALLRLTASFGSTSLSRRANDAGVDIVARLDFGDDGAGKWTFIGQVTCGKSDTWPGKAAEPSRARWSRLLGLVAWPAKFLAVPHEIPGQYRSEICVQGDHDVWLLDRRRLVTPARDLLRVEEILIERLYELEIEDLSRA